MTGWKGKVIGRNENLVGCLRYMVQGNVINKEGKQEFPDACSFDETVLKEIPGEHAKDIAAQRYGPGERGGPVECVSQKGLKAKAEKFSPDF